LGYTAERNDHARFPGHRFLAKPFGRDDLIEAVATALAEGETARS
jgi:FixJ family two-component response regulator